MITTFILKVFIILLVAILVCIFANWLDKFHDKHKEQFIKKALDNVSSLISSQLDSVVEQYKTGPWYLVVYTSETPYPLWISNNNIRSVHPDAEHSQLIIKLFNGEDMVIGDVDRYELCAANEMYDYDM